MQNAFFTRFCIIGVMAVALLILSSCATSSDVKPPDNMIGTWAGLGRNTMSSEFLDQREVPFMLIISDKGTIKGYVGDAMIANALFEKTSLLKRFFNKAKYQTTFQLSGNIINRESFRREGGTLFFNKAKYQTTFQLSGNIINRESFRREGGTLFFNKISSDELLCSFSSTGSQVSADDLILNVKDIVLRKQN